MDFTEALRLRFFLKVKQSENGCWEWQGATTDGYGVFCISCRRTKPTRERIVIGAHRAAYLMTHGAIEGELNVCHNCDNPLCCRPDHLFLGTDKQNHEDRNRKGRQAKGERNGAAKLNAAMVIMIRSRQGFLSQQATADEFKVSKTLIRYIWHRRIWAHI